MREGGAPTYFHEIYTDVVWINIRVSIHVVQCKPSPPSILFSQRFAYNVKIWKFNCLTNKANTERGTCPLTISHT